MVCGRVQFTRVTLHGPQNVAFHHFYFSTCFMEVCSIEFPLLSFLCCRPILWEFIRGLASTIAGWCTLTNFRINLFSYNFTSRNTADFRLPTIIQRTQSSHDLKFSMMMYPGHRQNWPDCGEAMLMVIKLMQYLLNKTVRFGDSFNWIIFRTNWKIVSNLPWRCVMGL